MSQAKQEVMTTTMLDNNMLVNYVRKVGPVKIGNVEFWIDEPTKWNGFTGQLCFSLPMSRWDCDAIKAELTAALLGD